LEGILGLAFYKHGAPNGAFPKPHSTEFSPYVRHGAVDSTMYSAISMLRTIGLIIGLRRMWQFDAAPTPMFNSFQAMPDLRP